MEEILAIDLYRMWGEGRAYNADRVYYWHADSEVVALDELDDGSFDIEYADGTVDTIPRFEVIFVQPINWSYDAKRR